MHFYRVALQDQLPYYQDDHILLLVWTLPTLKAFLWQGKYSRFVSYYHTNWRSAMHTLQCLVSYKKHYNVHSKALQDRLSSCILLFQECEREDLLLDHWTNLLKRQMRAAMLLTFVEYQIDWNDCLAMGYVKAHTNCYDETINSCTVCRTGIVAKILGCYAFHNTNQGLFSDWKVFVCKFIWCEIYQCKLHLFHYNCYYSCTEYSIILQWFPK